MNILTIKIKAISKRAEEMRYVKNSKPTGVLKKVLAIYLVIFERVKPTPIHPSQKKSLPRYAFHI